MLSQRTSKTSSALGTPEGPEFRTVREKAWRDGPSFRRLELVEKTE
jgi:hypothetical protein